MPTRRETPTDEVYGKIIHFLISVAIVSLLVRLFMGAANMREVLGFFGSGYETFFFMALALAAVLLLEQIRNKT